MAKRLTETEKLKYWMDTQFTMLQIFACIILLQVTQGWVWNIILGVYIVWSALYIIVRLAVIAADDPDYLRLPKR